MDRYTWQQVVDQMLFATDVDLDVSTLIFGLR
jgi:hypothetical protein